MTDVRVPDRSFSKLHPLLQRKLLDFFQACGKRRLAVLMTEGYRSQQRQEWLYAQGRTREGAVVTYARPGESYHNLRLAAVPCSAAADFAIWDEDQPWADALEWNGSEEEWKLFAQAAAEVGLRTLDFDHPHVALPHDLDVLKEGRFWPPDIERPEWPEPRVGLAGTHEFELRGPGAERRSR